MRTGVIRTLPFDFDSFNMAMNLLNKWKALKGSEEEIWEPIVEFPAYKISNYGRVKNNNGEVMLPDSSSLYWRYTLSDEGITKRYLSHRLVAIHFVPNSENKPCVNHKNGIKNYNYPPNLEWATHSENTRHALKTGLIIPVKGLCGKQNARSKPVIQMDLNEHPIKIWDSANLAALKLNLNPSIIGLVCRGNKKNHKVHGGFKWKFKN